MSTLRMLLLYVPGGHKDKEAATGHLVLDLGSTPCSRQLSVANPFVRRLRL